MRELTSAEKQRLSELCPQLQLLFNETRRELANMPAPVLMDIFLVCGHRGKDEQELAFAKGFSKVHFPNSKHNSMPSQAMDCCPHPIDWNNLSRFQFMNKIMMQVAERLQLKIRFGADFNQDGDLTNDKFVDLPHCEVA